MVQNHANQLSNSLEKNTSTFKILQMPFFRRLMSFALNNSDAK